MTFFDQMLLTNVADDWRKVARVVGETLGDQFDRWLDQANDLVLAGRIKALVESGLLEFQGDTPLNMYFSEIRLPQRIVSPPTAATG